MGQSIGDYLYNQRIDIENSKKNLFEKE